MVQVWTPKRRAIIGDEWPGGGSRTFENMGHEPVICASRSDYKREMDKRGLQPFVRHVPGSTQTSRWDVPSQYTLDAARALVERAGTASGTKAPDLTLTPITVTTLSLKGGV